MADVLRVLLAVVAAGSACLVIATVVRHLVLAVVTTRPQRPRRPGRPFEPAGAPARRSGTAQW